MFDILTTVSIKFTEEELSKILKRIARSNAVVITSIEAGSNSEKKGDSYLSIIYRFTVKATCTVIEK